MENQIAIRNNSFSGMPSEHEMMVFQTMSKAAVESKMYKGIGDQSGIMMIMLAARELGIQPCQALNGGLNIIQGKVEISARMMSALIRKAGHQIKVQESTELQCILEGKRCDTGETLSASFSVAEAQKAGLVKPGGGWTKWPKDMCFARALSRLSRQLFSDVIGIGYVEGEIKATECEIINPEPIVIEDHIEELESDVVSNYLTRFDKDDKPLALQYLEVVRKHFNWSVVNTVNELLKDEKSLFDKFTSWKNKIKKAEES